MVKDGVLNTKGFDGSGAAGNSIAGDPSDDTIFEFGFHQQAQE